jgi:hypothetical protein
MSIVEVDRSNGGYQDKLVLAFIDPYIDVPTECVRFFF